MAKSKEEIRARISMKEHLCLIQLSEMRRLFIDEATHSRTYFVVQLIHIFFLFLSPLRWVTIWNK